MNDIIQVCGYGAFGLNAGICERCGGKKSGGCDAKIYVLKDKDALLTALKEMGVECAPMKKGEWVFEWYNKCSLCGGAGHEHQKYCHHCGAKMEI